MPAPSRYIANVPWVDRILTEHWGELGESADEEHMPVAVKVSKRGKRKFDELGCGHYGCVMPTSDDGVVFKLTTDASEAAFVAAALSIGEFPDGIVRYQKIVELPEKYRNRRVFALWREAASMIGFPLMLWTPGAVTDPYIRRCWRDLEQNLGEYQAQAATVREYVRKASDPEAAVARIRSLERWAWDYTRDERCGRIVGAERAAVSLQRCEDAAEIMEHTCESDKIGGALGFYLEQGMLLADVHLNNVGVVTRPPDVDYDDWHAVNVITDPGHMVPLKKKWLSVSVPTV